MSNVMLDLETMGTKPGAPILSIGAVKFAKGQILDTLYQRISLKDSMAHGLMPDADTILWWMGQDDAARKELLQPAVPLTHALAAFSYFIGNERVCVWGNGAGFDNALLVTAYDKAHMTPPWKFWDDRCYRTVKNLHKVDIPPLPDGNIKHHALHDAVAQALHLMAIYPEL